MATQDKLTIFTAAMRTEFLNAYAAARADANFVAYESYTSVVPSTSRIEEYPWLSPPPRLAPYIGRRRYNTVDESKYRVENKEFDAALSIRLRDIRDDQVGGYPLLAKQMAQDVVQFPNRELIKHVKLGASKYCFDNSFFFADSHNIGTGDNLMTADNAGNDGVTHRVIALIKTGAVKPLIWQQRRDDGLQSSEGTWNEKEEKVQKWIYDYEAAPGFGFWWDAISMTITDTPSLTEVQNTIAAIEERFRGFKLEKAEVGEDDIYVHDQLTFNTSSIVYLVNPALESLFRRVLFASEINPGSGSQSNIWDGHGDLLISPYLTP